MSTDTPTDPVLDAVESLSDLFRRRLLDDKDKRRAFDVLYEQVEHARSQVDGTLLRPLVMDCIRVIDRLDRYRGDDRDFVKSLAAELLESLHRVGIEPIPNHVHEPFDPATQEVSRIQVGDDHPEGTVLGWERRGYRQGDQVIRTTLVVIAGSDTPEDLDDNEPADAVPDASPSISGDD
jgi:molecular chaperone GrpE